MHIIKDGRVVAVNPFDDHPDKGIGVIRKSNYDDEITPDQYEALRKVVPDEVKTRLVPIATTEGDR
ncbi:hypothetical protein [Kiloniella litopenaei]|nr:hypothetical protein [Kiloniella litopenaei]